MRTMRHNTKTALIITIVAAAAIFVLRCADLGPLAGTVTQSGNGYVCGVVIDSGALVPGARVLLIPAQFDPNSDAPLPDSFISTTDESGAFRIIAPLSQGYNVQVDHSSGKNALRCGIGFATGDTQTTGLLTLARPGSIKVIEPDTNNPGAAYVYIPGTTFFALVRSGTALLGDIPAGVIPELAFNPDIDGAEVYTISKNNTVVSGDTTLIFDYALWKDTLRLYLNTTASGAGVAGDVTNFPALVRLTSKNFDFSRALPGGNDVRFAKPDGAPLAFEIERWDAAAQTAEIWVRIDTVYGNDSTQSITMYWGNPDAFGTSNSTAVFDTAVGFAGVWHMGENGDSVSDATADAFHGANSGSAMAAGIIGNSRKFADGNYLKISGLLNSPSNVTLSAWVQSEKSTGGQDVISIGDAVMIRLDYLGGKGVSGWYHNSPITYDDSKYAIDSSGRYLANTGWHFLAFTISAETHVQTLYIDGEKCAVSNDLNPIYYAGLGVDTYIGIHGNGKTSYNFAGQIDEVRVSSIAESPDWVRLCYMNQKAQDALVKW